MEVGYKYFSWFFMKLAAFFDIIWQGQIESKTAIPPGRVEQIAPFTFCWSWYIHFYHDQSFEAVVHFIVPPCSSLCVEWYLVLQNYICMSHASDFLIFCLDKCIQYYDIIICN